MFLRVVPVFPAHPPDVRFKFMETFHFFEFVMVMDGWKTNFNRSVMCFHELVYSGLTYSITWRSAYVHVHLPETSNIQIHYFNQLNQSTMQSVITINQILSFQPHSHIRSVQKIKRIFKFSSCEYSILDYFVFLCWYTRPQHMLTLSAILHF